MTKRFSILLVVLTIVSGLIGGAITGRIFTPKVAVAEEATQSKVLTVEELRIVDKNGKVGAVMSVGENGGNVDVLDKDGKLKSSMQVNEYGNGTIGLWDKDGNKLK